MIYSFNFPTVIDSAINDHTKTINIIISDTAIAKYSDGSFSMGYYVETMGGGGCTCNYSDNRKIVAITGRNSIYDISMKDGSTTRYTPEEILMHDLGHAIPMLLSVTDGSAIFNENTIRKELRLNEREETYNDPVVNYNANGKFLFMPNK